MNRELRRRLEDVPVPEEKAAAERSWRVARAAFDDSPPALGPRPNNRLRLLPIPIALVALLTALALTPAGATVRRWIADTIKPGEKHAKPALTAVPGGGELLVQSADGPWVVSSDGSKRLLGDYSDADFSPRARFVAVTKGHQLTALEPDGTVRWSVSSAEKLSEPSWETYPGYRVAYRSAQSVRVAIGDGSSDHRLAGNTSPVRPAWAPVDPEVADSRGAVGLPVAHHLAFVKAGRVQFRDADTGKHIWQSERLGRISSLQWSANGSRLLVVVASGVFVFNRAGDVVATPADVPMFRRAGDFVPHLQATIDASGRRVAMIADNGTGTSTLRVVNLDTFKTQARFAGPGRFDAVAWSPASSKVLLSWKAADQWLFFNPANEHVTAIGSIAGQFDPGARSPAFPQLLGWCCPG